MDHPPIRRPLGELDTDRLSLRRFRSEDLDELAVVFARPEVWHYPFGRGFTREETAAFLERQQAEWQARRFGCWVARARAGGRLLGYVGLSVPTFLPEVLPAVEVGWRLDPDAWGHGYASEGARAALGQAFTTLGLEEICAVVQVENAASIRVCERIGMRLARSVTVPANDRWGPADVFLFGARRREWLDRPTRRSAGTPRGPR